MASALFKDSSVAVAVRIRPLNKREIGLKSAEIARATSPQVIHMDDNPDTVQDDDRDYAYDGVFGPESKQTEVYDATAKHVLDRVIDGYNATIFACESVLRQLCSCLSRVSIDSAVFHRYVLRNQDTLYLNQDTSMSDSCESEPYGDSIVTGM